MTDPDPTWVPISSAEQAVSLLKLLEGKTLTLLTMKSYSRSRIEPFQRRRVTIQRIEAVTTDLTGPEDPPWLSIEYADGELSVFVSPTYYDIAIAVDPTGTMIQMRCVGHGRRGTRVHIFLL